MREPHVILEGSSWLVLDKPPDWVVNDSKTTNNNTVQSFILNNLKTEVSHNLELRCGVVHRLDKETSGVLLVAKDEASFYALQKQFADRSVTKTYTALVHGEIKGGGVINAPLGRNPLNRRRFTVLALGREATTEFEVLKSYKRENEIFTLVSVTPKTGRTHQIRVHFKHIGHPLVSDPLYVGRKTLVRDLKLCPRLFLHASKIKFLDPNTKESITAKADLPFDLENTLSLLKA